LRRALLAALLFGTVGMFAELLLLGHIDGVWQWIPVVLLACGALAMAWELVRPSSLSLQVFRLLMALFVVSGVVGLALHYKGNVEFEREMYPALAGWQLFKQAITGATPALAPGTMSLFGLFGWLYTFRKNNSPVGGRS
jgi:hypothetical protein